ncbi:MAG TPA: sigma-70 family RNA polymerase sigma factor [Polyangiaceae bacterium]
MKKGSEGASRRPEVPSFAEIFRDHMPFLWRATLALGVPPSDAEDVCQEIMLVVNRRLGDFDGRSLKSWLYGICLRVTSDYRRSARVRRERATDQIPDEGFAAPQPEHVDALRAERRLRQALDALDYERREVFVLFEIEQLTLREIAEASETPLQTVYSRLQAARAHVRAFCRMMNAEEVPRAVG